ncbi:hypothetical protein J1N35_035203 [Gossypium stocksii]|uniref:Transposase (putative) gypsy type domain-containing protein n=1 Tax=Gossypium stocksii TaxID=47602 RepID=A0A9D3UTG6_9ROSI|nr:hypothetical protein J1N35_035203 [Gossypium stocksii]
MYNNLLSLSEPKGCYKVTPLRSIMSSLNAACWVCCKMICIKIALPCARVERSHRLCETTEHSFLLPLYALEARFHLSLHPFFCSLLKEYGIAPDQLSGFSWWIAMVYFLNCSQHGEVPLLAIFQHLYKLKGHNRKNLTREYFSILLKGFSPNGWRLGDNRNVAQSIGVLPKRSTWPHDAVDELGLILWGSREEPINFFYHFYKMSFHPFALTAEKEGNNEQLEQRSKKRADPIGSVAIVVEASNSPSSPVTSLSSIPLASLSIATDEDTSPSASHVSLFVPIVGERPVGSNGGYLCGVKIRAHRNTLTILMMWPLDGKLCQRLRG